MVTSGQGYAGLTQEAGVPFNLSAVEFSTPTDEDFTPPAEPVSLSDMMGD